MQGQMKIEGEKRKFTILPFYKSINEARPFEGIAIHTDCVHVIEKALDGKLSYKQAIMIREVEHDDLKGYNEGEFFNWRRATSNNEYDDEYDEEEESEGPLPEWMFESPLHNEMARQRIIQSIPSEIIKKRTLNRSRMVHTMVSKIPNLNGIGPDIASLVTPFATGLKPYEYMPEKFVTSKNRKSIKGGRKLRKTRKNRNLRK